MAIDDVYDEHEQSERVLAWLRRNGAALIGGIALGLAAIAGWNWWGAQQAAKGAAVATQYQATVSAIAANGPDATTKLTALPPGSAYRTLASLKLAGAQVQAGKHEGALATLRAIRTDDPVLRSVVDARIARLLIDAKQAKAAVELLADDASAAAEEIRGDAHLALGDAAKAREAYGRALRTLDVAAPSRRLIELKLTEAGGTPATTETKS